MHYWNKESFEGSVLVAAALSNAPELAAVSRYCALREKGLRKRALAEVRELIVAAHGWSASTRRSSVERLLQVWHAHPEVHWLLSQPLVDGFLLPTLEEWVRTEPGSAVAQRWLGMVSGERARLERALALDPTDDIARGRLVAMLLGDVDYSTHHLVEGSFIGRESDAAEALRSAEDLLKSAFDHTKFARLESRLSRLRSLLEDWTAYNQAPEIEFREWCALRGRAYDWPTIVYYDNGAG